MTTGTTGVISMCEQPIPAQGTRQVPQTDAPVRAVRTRRVGTFTCGVALVLTGLAIGIYLIWPRFDLLFFFRLCPLLLVLLGGELLAASFSRSELRIKYDFVSMVLCLVIGVAALVLSIIPVAVRWISPDHLAVQQQITAKADEEIYRLLGDDAAVADCRSSAFVYFPTALQSDTQPDELHFDLTLRGPYADAGAFAADCARVRDKILQGGLSPTLLTFFWSDETTDYSLFLDSAFSLHASAAQLAAQVETN